MKFFFSLKYLHLGMFSFGKYLLLPTILWIVFIANSWVKNLLQSASKITAELSNAIKICEPYPHVEREIREINIFIISKLKKDSWSKKGSFVKSDGKLDELLPHLSRSLIWSNKMWRFWKLYEEKNEHRTLTICKWN